MPNFAQEIEAAVAREGESIEAICVSGMRGSYDYGDSDAANLVPLELRNIPVKWEEVREFLDYEYNNGYGGADCHRVYVWTNSSIIVVSEYDGATGLQSFPRNPTAGEPSFAG